MKFSDTDLYVRVHHEADDTIKFTGGDDLAGVTNIQVGLMYTNAAGTLVTATATPGGDGYAALSGDILRLKPVFVTIEPAGGVTSPSGQVVLTNQP